MRLTEATLERLSTELDAYNRANLAARNGSVQAVDASIRAYNRLLDTCLELGMDRNDEADLWAAGRVGFWLRAA